MVAKGCRFVQNSCASLLRATGATKVQLKPAVTSVARPAQSRPRRLAVTRRGCFGRMDGSHILCQTIELMPGRSEFPLEDGCGSQRTPDRPDK